MTSQDKILEDIYKIAATATVMTGHDGASSGMSGHHYERTRIMLRKDIKEFLESEGLDISTVVNRLLENFIVAYKVFWDLERRGWDYDVEDHKHTKKLIKKFNIISYNEVIRHRTTNRKRTRKDR